MTLRDFSAKYRLTGARVADGEEVLKGEQGQVSLHNVTGDIYEVWYCPDLEGDATEDVFAGYCRTWGRLKKHFVELGMEIHQDATGEGAALFDPQEPRQARAAVRAVGLRRKKRINVTPELLERLGRARAARAARHNDTSPDA